MQPDNIRPASRIPNMAFSGIERLPVEGLRRARQRERPKRDDSMESIIVHARVNSQSIATGTAPQQAGCVIFAASLSPGARRAAPRSETAAGHKKAPAGPALSTRLPDKAYCIDA